MRLADRSLRQTNPLLALAARLLELASARLTASEVLDLLDTPPVRWRFHLSDDDISTLRSWVCRGPDPLGTGRRPPGRLEAVGR